MKRAQLILLDNPIIVTDEEIQEHSEDKFYSFETNRVYDCKTHLSTVSCKKVINKQIDYNNIDFGIVDVEKLAELKANEIGFHFGGHSKFVQGFIEGFNASQKLNEKKFSEADMIECFNAARRYRMKNVFEFEFAKEYLDNMQPKTFDIEIEETETHIKILRKL